MWEMLIDGHYVLAKVDPGEVNTVTRESIQINGVIFSQLRLQCNMKLCVIKLLNWITGNCLGTSQNLPALLAYEIRALQSNGLSCMLSLIIQLHFID